jgi:uncharacterized membrane protein YciS (DUF1049 family)
MSQLHNFQYCLILPCCTGFNYMLTHDNRLVFHMCRWIIFVKSLSFCVTILIAGLAYFSNKYKLRVTKRVRAVLIVPRVRATSALKIHYNVTRPYCNPICYAVLTATNIFHRVSDRKRRVS